MTEREQVKQVIAVLEAQRALLGDVVADTTITTLQERLGLLEDDLTNKVVHRTAQRKQVTILFANVTGFMGVAESILDTDMLDIMNLLWRRLDGAITQQDGMIDKHIGDAVMGLFGVPVAREDDPERAIRTALAMRATLSDFVNEFNAEEDTEVAHLRPQMAANSSFLKGLQLRIGINTGPVLLGEVGTGDEYTVIGDAVNVASRLERAAPPGGILISHDTYLLVRGIFNIEPLGPVTIKGKSDPVQVYLVLGMQPRLFYPTGRGVEGVETHMVGRDEELRRLQEALQTAVKSRVGRLITVVGDAGVGKSRLVHEFNHWVRSLPYEVPLFKGRTDQRTSQLPYALIRDLFTTYFGIQDNDPAAVAEEKFVQGMGHLMDQSADEARSRAHAIGQLIGLDLLEDLQLPLAPVESRQIRDRAFNYVADFFAAVSTVSPASIIFLEDLHWADEGSLNLVARLVEDCRRVPLLIICLSRTALPESWSLPGNSATVNGDGPPELPPQTCIQLAPLSEDECRLLVVDILRKLPEIPADLCDLIVTRAEGNPFYVEELVKVLIEDGVILAGSDRWQVQRSQLTSLRVPLTLTGVLQARLDRLSALERVTLQRAAVVGRVFWDSLMIEMNNMADEPLSATETFTALQALEKRELIFQRQVSMFAGARTYFFKHAILREVTYESVLLRERPAYHKQVADWLAEQSGERVAEYAGLIARHYELAGEKTPAAELYEMAGIRAQDMYNPEVAIDYYARALSLLSDKSHDATWQLRLQERLGELLRLQARLVEAAQTYMTMRYTAKMDGDLIMEARAWNGLAGIQREQADYAAMLESASQAEQVAWLVSADLELARVLLYKSEAYWRLDDTELALASARRALEISQRTNDADQTALGLSLLSSIYLELGRQTRATDYLERLEEQLQALDRETPPKTIAFNKVLLGSAYNKLGYYDKAAYHLLGALKLYREADYQLAVGNTLNALAETARLRGNPRAAVPLCRQALAVAEGIGNHYDTLAYHTNLGGALVDLGNYQAAETELRGVISLAEDYSKVVTWRGLADTYRFLAQACLGQEQVMEALAWAHRARHFALHNGGMELLGVTWRVLGQVVAQLPPQVLPVTIEDALYDAPGCFAESLRLLQEANGGAGVHRERVRTLWAWAIHELARGNKERGREMAQEAQAIAGQLGMELPK